MKLDIYKFSEWLEKTVQAGIADERALRELKLNKRLASQPQTDGDSGAIKAS